MSDFSNALRITTSGMRMQSSRLSLISQNLANVDTPGYHRKTAAVQVQRDGGGAVQLGRVALSNAALERIFDPSHPLADDTGHFEGSNVDMLIELADAREAQRTYEANLKLFDQTRQMSSSLMDLLRR